MQLHLAPAATAVMLSLLSGVSVFAAEAQDDVCTGSKPFREVAQDETRTMAELCAIQEERLREDRGWKDTPPVARRNGELRQCFCQTGLAGSCLKSHRHSPGYSHLAQSL